MRDHDILVQILNNDPDGMPKQPSEWAREKFRAWVVENYGEDMLARYHTSWDYA